MFGKCTRRLALRWSLLVFLIGELSMALYRIVHGSGPITNILVIVRRSNPSNGWYAHLPIAIPRFVDPLIAMIPAALLVWAICDQKLIYHKWLVTKSTDGYVGALTCGMVIGAGGSLIAANTDIRGLIAGAVVTGLLMLFALACDWDGGQKVLPLGPFATVPVAAVTLWCLMTMFQGAVAGLLYASVGFLATAITYYGIWGMFAGVGWFFEGPFKRTMIDCPVEGNC